jgi:ligand-binding sensor domain-containing protein
MATRFALLLITICFLQLDVHSQEQPIGAWRSHLPYNSCIGIASDGKSLFVNSATSFYTLNMTTNETEGHSKVDGMADQGMSVIGYDTLTNTVVITYANSNIDLYSDDKFYNLPQLKTKSYSSSKQVNNVYTVNGYAYLSTGVGIVVIDLKRRSIKETYSFSLNSQNIGIYGITIANGYIYAATEKGLYKAPKNSVTIQSFPTWVKLDTTRNFISITSLNNKVFVAKADSFFALENDVLKFVYRNDTNITHIDAGNGGIWVSEYSKVTFTGKIKKFATDTYQLLDTFNLSGKSRQVLTTDNTTMWIADEFLGMRKQEFGGQPFGTKVPEGPNFFTCYDIYAYDNDVWVTHGGYDDKQKAFGYGYGFSNYKDDKWKIYKQYDYTVFGDSMLDFTRVIKGPDGTMYYGSAQSGLLIVKTDGKTEYYKQNSFIDPSSVSGTWYRIGGFAFDSKSNLWMTVYGGQHQLAVRATNGTFYTYSVPVSTGTVPNAAADIVVDDNGQKWYATSGAASGVVVYNDNGTIENANDDSYRQLLSGKGSGGLADNEVYCLAKDKNGAIWIGTKNGISIVSCTGQVISGGCEADNKIVQYDDFAGYLFQTQAVRTIAVDGANRKWVGTNNGVWLISAEGDKIVSRFTIDNSPLPSNAIQKITIDPVTGDVYIGTESGLVSYRGTATEGGKENSNVKVFPNPVQSGYTGTIAIKGLVDNADVRITDISGQLVYKTKALGGQAVWNGLDYTGRRPQSGVYLIFATNKDGSQKNVSKMVFME